MRRRHGDSTGHDTVPLGGIVVAESARRLLVDFIPKPGDLENSEKEDGIDETGDDEGGDILPPSALDTAADEVELAEKSASGRHSYHRESGDGESDTGDGRLFEKYPEIGDFTDAVKLEEDTRGEEKAEGHHRVGEDVVGGPGEAPEIRIIEPGPAHHITDLGDDEIA